MMGANASTIAKSEIDKLVDLLVGYGFGFNHSTALEVIKEAINDFTWESHWHMKHRIVCLQCGSANVKFYEPPGDQWICLNCGVNYPKDHFDHIKPLKLNDILAGKI